MSRRIIAFIVFALAISVGCIQLGRWQLTRLEERRARNRIIAGRLAEAPTSLSNALLTPDVARYRRVEIEGTWDYDHEYVLTSRGRSGSPGVHLLTPLRLTSTGGDTAVLVIRGWVYSPDGATIDLQRWRATPDGWVAHINGYVDDFTSGATPVASPRGPQALRRADRDSLSRRIPYPIASALVVQTSDSAERADHPARLAAPVLTDGPHKSYALQWFAFAAIAWLGVGAVVAAERKNRKREMGEGSSVS